MIEGVVTLQGVPQVQLSVGGRTWPAIIDTGFNGDLELPNALRPHLSPQFVGVVESSLAAGRTVREDCFLVEFTFDGETRQVETTFTESEHMLVGTGMLVNHILAIDFPAGTLSINR